MLQQVERLEEALELVERIGFFYGSFTKFVDECKKVGRKFNCAPEAENCRTGIFVNHGGLREHLLRAYTESFDDNRFGFPLDASLLKTLARYAHIPMALWEWTRYSRRVYSLDDDLQTLLENTAINRVRWAELKLPFESFALALARPIRDPDNILSFDCILVSQLEENGARLIQFTLFGEGLERIFPLNYVSRHRITEKLRLKDLPGLGKIFHKIYEQSLGHASPIFSFLIPATAIGSEALGTVGSLLESVMSAVGSSSQEFADTFGIEEEIIVSEGAELRFPEIAARLVAGVCLYLQHIAPRAPGGHGSQWNPPATSPSARAIIHGAQVCAVKSVERLSSEETDIVRDFRDRPTRELCTHWRSGHWRKPPGQGHDPLAPRSIWIRPILVRRDRLAPGTLPVGLGKPPG
ncbi:MAG: hypothetical protein V1821_00920 [bacterium]